MGVSPPTSTLSYIFPAKTRGPGGEVLRAASLTQPAAPSAESIWGRGARPPTPQPRLATRAGGRPSPEVPRQSRPAAPPVPGEQRGSCVGGGGGPSAPPGNARPRPGNSAAPPRGGSRLEQHAVRGRVPRLPKCAGRGGIGAGRGERGAGGRRTLPPPLRGCRASPRRGFRVGVGTPRGSAFARPGAARRRSVSEVRAAAPRPEPARPLPGGPTPFPSAPSRPGTAPDLTLARRVRLRLAKRRELTERGGLWRASWWGGGGLGRGRIEKGEGRTGEKAPEEEYAEDGRRQGTRRGGGCARRQGRKRGGRLPHPSSGSQPPRSLVSPRPSAAGGEVMGRGGGGGPGVLPQHTPHPARASFA